MHQVRFRESHQKTDLIKKTFSEQVEKEGKRVVQLHLLVADGQHEADGAQQVTVKHQGSDGEDHQAQGNSVVLEVAVIDEN